MGLGPNNVDSRDRRRIIDGKEVNDIFNHMVKSQCNPLGISLYFGDVVNERPRIELSFGVNGSLIL